MNWCVGLVCIRQGRLVFSSILLWQWLVFFWVSSVICCVGDVFWIISRWLLGLSQFSMCLGKCVMVLVSIIVLNWFCGCQVSMVLLVVSLMLLIVVVINWVVVVVVKLVWMFMFIILLVSLVRYVVRKFELVLIFSMCLVDVSFRVCSMWFLSMGFIIIFL